MIRPRSPIIRSTAVRLAKLGSLRDQGIDPYPAGFRRTAMAGDLAARYASLEDGVETEDEVTVAGRILNVRSFGKLRFAVLADGSGTIQLFVHAAVTRRDPARSLRPDRQWRLGWGAEAPS